MEALVHLDSSRQRGGSFMGTDNTLKKSLAAAGRIHLRQQAINVPPEPTKIMGKTSKKCPKCGSKREREWRVGRSVALRETDPLLPIAPARSAHWFIARAPLLRNLFGTPEYSTDRSQNDLHSHGWHECWCIATCPRCGVVRVNELDYVRKFSLFRIFFIRLEEQIPILRIIFRSR